ncbi:MAG: 3-deoxy-D-manno-octulosonic acid transferase [Alphaproteobacteria bacterium]|nr:3-deoxy-D-manno-octulosonic acid transferase [Alphaproteobacteria bacterium]
MTLLLTAYRAVMAAFHPFASQVMAGRLRAGKERPERLPERFGRATAARPVGDLIWLHAASVGEMRLLLDLFGGLREQCGDVRAVITTQTLTSADLVAKLAPPGLIHQMAPVDTPQSMGRFLNYWRPSALVLAEGEIWPGMLTEIRKRGIPSALVNARMTQSSLRGWMRVGRSARELLSSFTFIGAADDTTRKGLETLAGTRISVCGNLKQAVRSKPAAAERIQDLRTALKKRPVCLAASTHPGEEAFALTAFSHVRKQRPDALLIIAPRHPERGDDILSLARSFGFTSRRRTADPAHPDPELDVLIADTLGEMPLWFAVSDGVFLGGATADDVGGHNAMEPAALGRRVLTGPNGFNFVDMFRDLRVINALEIASLPEELSAFWLREIGAPPLEQEGVERLLQTAQEARSETLSALCDLMSGARRHA